MSNYNPQNERMKRQYFTYLKEALRYSESTVDGVAKALNRFEKYTKYRDFKTFHIQQAISFKKHLAEQRNARSGERLSKTTLYATLTQLKQFFHWLAGQPGYKSRIQYSDAEYFNLSEKDTRIAKAAREKKIPTIEQIRHTIKNMPTESDIDLRNRALIAFTLLTGARDGALISLKLKHVDIASQKVLQDAREVKTKFSKTFSTFFFPIGDDILSIVADWVELLREQRFWSDSDPLFPASRVVQGQNYRFQTVGLQRKHWSTATPIRTVFREAFEQANLPYFNPHSFRNTLVRLGESLCRTPEDFKAWSQNLGHEQVLTTFTSYGEVSSPRQQEIINGLGKNEEDSHINTEELIAKIAKHVGVQ